MAGWIGRTLSKVEIQKLLGRGGMAEVYMGRHTTLNRPVAVKILHGHLSGDDTVLARFRSEAQAVAAMRHPNVIQVFDFDVVEDQPYIIMELLEGPSLADYLSVLRRMKRPMPPQSAARLATYICAALDYAHARGIVHRDVKPSNVLLRRENGPVEMKLPLPDDVLPVLTDFGVARMANATVQTASGMIVGTPAYMSPEQVSGETVDARSDIYSLGIMLYEMLTNRLPFDSESDTVAATLIKHITEPPPPMPEVEPGVERVILHALAKDRRERYQSAGELALDLRAVLRMPITPAEALLIPSTPPLGVQSSVGRGPMKPQVRMDAGKRQSRRPMLLIVAAVLAILLGTAAVLTVLTLTDEDEPPTVIGAEGQENAAVPSSRGMLHWADGSAEVNQVRLEVSGLVPLSADSLYEAWLLGGETRRSLGTLDVDESGVGALTFESEEGENLMAGFGEFEITVEPNPDSNPLPTNRVAYAGAVPDEALMHIRHLVVAFDGAPDSTGLTLGLMHDADLMYAATVALFEGAENGDVVEVRRQAEALVNIIEGQGGANYGDLDGDGTVSDPSDGFGVLPSAGGTGYIQGTIEHARYSAGTATATEWIKTNAAYLEAAAQNLGGWAAELRDLALAVATGEGETSAEQAQEIVRLTNLFLSGEDADGDGVVEPVAGEGGAETVYQYALAMGSMPVLPVAEPEQQSAAPDSEEAENRSSGYGIYD